MQVVPFLKCLVVVWNCILSSSYPSILEADISESSRVGVVGRFVHVSRCFSVVYSSGQGLSLAEMFLQVSLLLQASQLLGRGFFPSSQYPSLGEPASAPGTLFCGEGPFKSASFFTWFNDRHIIATFNLVSKQGFF